jgi:bifunctional non-homologous end joining protein LigD
MSTIALERPPGSVAALPATPEPVPYLPRALPFDDPGWVFQPKYEGLRGFVVRTSDGCEIRTGRELRQDRLAELAERVAAVLGPRGAILDGEVVALDRDGRPSLRELLRGRTLLSFGAFDLLWLDGEDLRHRPLSERQRRLSALLPTDTGPLYKMFVLEEHGRALFQAARRMELEGIVAKRMQDPYGQDTVWYSIRNPGYTLDDGRIDPFRPRARARRADREAQES